MFTTPDVVKPAGKQPGVPQVGAVSDQIRGGQGSGHEVIMVGEQVRVTFGDVPLPFNGQLHLTFKVRAGKLGHYHLADRDSITKIFRTPRPSPTKEEGLVHFFFYAMALNPSFLYLGELGMSRRLRPTASQNLDSYRGNLI
jgi:hypothetical protein